MRPMLPMTLSDIETAPFQVRLTQELSISPELVFAELADPQRWTQWFPLMRQARWVSNTTQAVGAEREVTLLALGRFHERMLAWEPGVRLTFTMLASTSPLASQMTEDHRLTRTATGGTRFDYCAALVPTALGKLASGGLRFMLQQLVTRAGKNLERVAKARARN
jgi:uncharacterized protein YndB with AHSA1/START domain